MQRILFFLLLIFFQLLSNSLLAQVKKKQKVTESCRCGVEIIPDSMIIRISPQNPFKFCEDTKTFFRNQTFPKNSFVSNGQS